MLGAIVVTGFILYFWLLYWVTRRAYLWAIHRGYTKPRSAIFGFFGFLLVYLPIFWDFLPLLVMKQYYCSKDGGFTLHQSPEQWVRDNPDRARNAFFYKRVQPTDKNGFQASGNYFVNKAATSTVIDGWLEKYEYEFIDIEKNEVMFIRRSYLSKRGFSASEISLEKYKFWLNMGQCAEENSLESKYINAFEAIGVRK